MSYWILFFPTTRETVMDLDMRNSGFGQSQFHSVDRGREEGTYVIK